MASGSAELLIALISVGALLLAPLVSRLITGVGRQISADVDRSSWEHGVYPPSEGALRETEIRELREALAYLRSRADARDEARRSGA